MVYLIFYDIQNDKTRKKVADKLIEFGYERLQYSVFAGYENPKRLSGLWRILEKIVKSNKNHLEKLYALRVEESSFKKMIILGKVNFDIDYVIGKKNTIIV